MIPAADRVHDSVGNWVDGHAPRWARPYLRMTRLDRPIGWWLLLLPCWWSAALAAIPAHQPGPNLWHLALFLVGAIAMRGAGCTWNDLADRDIDAHVERTRSRPIPSGQISVRAAVIFLIAQGLLGLVVLVQFNSFAILVGVASLVTVVIYPFMKRITYWPQIFLGLAFSWGALMGWAAVFGRLDWPAIALYLGAISWVIGYDTIYAHQDRDDDAVVGIKSTALLFGESTRSALALFYAAAVALIGIACWGAGVGWPTGAALAGFAAHLAWQVRRIDIADPALCLRLFRANRDAGLILFAGLSMDGIVASLT